MVTAAAVTVSLDGGAIVLFAVGVVAVVALFAFRPVPGGSSTVCLCPACGEDLVTTNSYIGQDVKILTPQAHPSETFRCATCGTFSAWDFDMFPVPTMLSFHMDGGELDLDEIRREGADPDGFQEDPDGR